MQEGTPAQRARGMAVGVFSGCFPLFGLQTLLGIMLASFVRGNRLLAATGTWISNPFTYLPLYWFNFKVGSKFLGQYSHQVTNVRDLTKQQLWNEGWLFSGRLLIGSTLVGLILGSIIGFILYFSLKALGSRKTPD